MPSFKTILGWVFLALVVWWIITQPVAAADLVKGIGHLLGIAAKGLGTFVTTVLPGG